MKEDLNPVLFAVGASSPSSKIDEDGVSIGRGHLPRGDHGLRPRVRRPCPELGHPDFTELQPPKVSGYEAGDHHLRHDVLLLGNRKSIGAH
jgi:hypothetical protein